MGEFDDYDPVDKVVLIRDHTVKNRHLDVKKAISKADMDKMKRGGPSPGSSLSGRGGYDRGPRDAGRGWANGDQWVGSNNYRGGGGNRSDYGNGPWESSSGNSNWSGNQGGGGGGGSGNGG